LFNTDPLDSDEKEAGVDVVKVRLLVNAFFVVVNPAEVDVEVEVEVEVDVDDDDKNDNDDKDENMYRFIFAATGAELVVAFFEIERNIINAAVRFVTTDDYYVNSTLSVVLFNFLSAMCER
jgi:hypothetical protein